jgi:hypothetical protein
MQVPSHEQEGSRRGRVQLGFACAVLSGIVLVGCMVSSRPTHAHSDSLSNQLLYRQIMTNEARFQQLLTSLRDDAVLQELAPTNDKAVAAAKLSPSKKAAIAAQMKALRSQIDNDFSSMTHYGKEVGYLPPPQSIRQQAMSGGLFKQKDIPVPPPFSASVAVPPLKGVKLDKNAVKKAAKTGKKLLSGAATAPAADPPVTAPAQPAALKKQPPALAPLSQPKTPPAKPPNPPPPSSSPPPPPPTQPQSPPAQKKVPDTSPPLFNIPSNPPPPLSPLSPPTPASQKTVAASIKPAAEKKGHSDWKAAFSFMHDGKVDRGDLKKGVPKSGNHEPAAVKNEQKFFLKAMHESSNGKTAAVVIGHHGHDKATTVGLKTSKSKPVWRKDKFLKDYFGGR